MGSKPGRSFLKRFNWSVFIFAFKGYFNYYFMSGFAKLKRVLGITFVYNFNLFAS
jgi:hypothetical protein